MSYWTYYLVWMFLAYGLRQPWLLAGVVVFLVLRRFIPDPGAIFRAFGLSKRLRAQVEMNAANITARRDLAVIYLDMRRPRAALALTQQALERAPDDPELLYLQGLALERVGRHEEALTPLVRAVAIEPRVRFGLPYLVAGDALLALGRAEAALDAYERYTDTNSSDVYGQVRLAHAHARLGDRKSGSAALREARSNWHALRGRLKRRSFFDYLGAHWARVWLLREPVALIGASALLGGIILCALSAYPLVVSYLHARHTRHVAEQYRTLELNKLLHGFALCGSQSTGDFAGQYISERSENFEILTDRIRVNGALVQEFCVTRVLERSPTQLQAEVVWHEDVNDRGDASIETIRLVRDGDTVHFFMRDPEAHVDAELAKLRKK